MTSSVLFGYVMVQNRIFWTIGEHLYFVYYPIIYYQRINGIIVETMDIERYHWNNDVSDKVLLEQWGQWKIKSWSVLWYKVRDKILW